MRRQVRAGIRDVQDGKPLQQPRIHGQGITPTYNNETILKVPQREGDDQAVLRAFGHKICTAVVASDHLPVGERQAFVEQAVRDMRDSGAFYEGSQAPVRKMEADANV
jgi:hypothetical protein